MKAMVAVSIVLAAFAANGLISMVAAQVAQKNAREIPKGDLYVTEVQDSKRVQKFTFKGMQTVTVR